MSPVLAFDVGGAATGVKSRKENEGRGFWGLKKCASLSLSVWEAVMGAKDLLAPGWLPVYVFRGDALRSCKVFLSHCAF